MPFDKSTQNVTSSGGPLIYPEVARAGYLGTSNAKLVENATNLPSRCLVNLANVTANTNRTASLYVVLEGETPDDADSVAKNLPFEAYEAIEAPAMQEFYLPPGGELWGQASHASSITAYIVQFKYL